MTLSRVPGVNSVVSNRPGTRIRCPSNRTGLSDLIRIGDWCHRNSRKASVGSFGVV